MLDLQYRQFSLDYLLLLKLFAVVGRMNDMPMLLILTVPSHGHFFIKEAFSS
jgi:hypothetical protein